MPTSRAPKLGKAVAVHRHQWLWEPLETDSTFVLRSMFGAKAVYLSGKMMFCFCAGEEPWRGLLVCTDHAHHPALCAEFADLRPHPILPKWLYLPEAADGFERAGQRLVELARRRDPRIGIVPKVRQKRARKVPLRRRAPRP